MMRRRLGPFEVNPIGLGCMNLSHAYGVPPTPESGRSLILRAFELGCDHFDTASLYGFGANEELVGATIKDFRDQILLASKGGMTGIDGKRVIDGRHDSIKRDCENSLRRLQTEVIDLYYLHRWDKNLPTEESVGALAELVAEGKIRAIGLSEVSSETLRRAHAIHPIAALQSEYSLWTRQPEAKTLASCDELGVSFVAFSPLGRGFLTAAPPHPDKLVAGDFRVGMPRFRAPNFERNQVIHGQFCALAAEFGIPPATLALAWLLQRGERILPIPGTTSLAHLAENMAAADITLSAAQIARLDETVHDRLISGERYPAQAMSEVDMD